MKKVLSVILAGVLSLSMLTACGGEEAPTYDVNEVITKITEKVPVAMEGDITEEELTILMGLAAEDFTSFAGKISMANVSSDRVIVIEAAEGKIDVVQQALEAYKESVVNSFELYLPDQYEKAKAGRVVVKGNYAVLVIGGDNIVIADQGVEEAYKVVDEAIDAAFN